jgi:integrase
VASAEAPPARSGRGRPPLEAGEHGRVTTRAWVIDKTTGQPRRRRTAATPEHKADSKRLPTAYWTAETYVNTGEARRRIQARGTTRDAAVTELAGRLRGPEHDLLAEAIAEETGHSRTFSDRSTLGHVLDQWIADPTTTRTRSVGTLARYQHAITRSIKARRIGATTLGQVRLDRVTPRLVTLYLASLTPAVAKTCRGILRQALAYAVANGAHSPTLHGTFALLSQRIDRGTSTLDGKGTVGITKAQADQIITDLRADDRTRRTDLPDLLQFIAGTGCRTSEATALTWDQLDLDALPATVLINATINGIGQRQPHTKTRAGVRRLTLPAAVADMLRNRQASARPDGQLVFPATRRRNAKHVETPYWTSNITGQIRTELDRLGHTGISGRSFRKMVATELDKHGYTPRQIADQLGHARPSVTLDIYQTRENTGPATVATIL